MDIIISNGATEYILKHSKENAVVVSLQSSGGG